MIKKEPLVLMIMLILTGLLVACGGAAPEAGPDPTEAPVEPTDTPPEVPTEIPTKIPTEEPTAVPTEPPAPEPTDEPEEESADSDTDETSGAAYSGPVTEIAIRRFNEGQDVGAFADARAGYISVLTEQDGIVADREFAPFVDFLTFSAPRPYVFIGMTEYEDMAAFETASGTAGATNEAGTFFSTFNPEVFTVMRPLNADDRYELATFATEPGQVLEVAVRDLSSYDNFDQAAYETTRDAFLEALSEQDGWVREMQWVSMFDPNIVVGMTVYESVEKYFAIYSSEFGTSEVSNAFAGGYPLVAGFASLDANSVPLPPNTLAFGDAVFAPETMSVNDGNGYTSNFFDGTISKINLGTGETTVLVEAGTDGAAAGWGLWYDDFSGELLACHARGEGEGNGVWALDADSGEILATWELPEGALCNSLIALENGDIYLTDVSPKADFIKIDRATGEAEILIDEPSWENDSGFGLGGLVWDGGDNFYASGPGIIRIPISDPSAWVAQTVIDPDGNPAPLTFDGSAWSSTSSTFFVASFDFQAFQSLVVEFSPLGDDTLQAETIFTGAIAATGIDADGGNLYVSDGQIIPALFNPDYVPATPFRMYTIPLE